MFTGQSDVFHYEIASPPAMRHVSHLHKPPAARDPRDALRLSLVTSFENRRFALQRKGARIFSVSAHVANRPCVAVALTHRPRAAQVAELSRLVDGKDAGLRAFHDDEDLAKLRALPRSRLVEMLSVFYTPDALAPLKKEALMALLVEAREKDMQDAQVLR
jgi:hypothetical protein